MDRARTLAAASIGFAAGLAWIVACDAGPDTAEASDGAGRTVLEIQYHTSGERCSVASGTALTHERDCCPAGYDLLGYSNSGAQICVGG